MNFSTPEIVVEELIGGSFYNNVVKKKGWGLNLVHVVVECPLVEKFMVDKSVVEKLGV